ncbi:hypothetical protein ABH917_001765 [Thermobifida halotolerans]
MSTAAARSACSRLPSGSEAASASTAPLQHGGVERVEEGVPGGGQGQVAGGQPRVAVQQGTPDVHGQSGPVVESGEPGGEHERGDPLGVAGRRADGDRGSQRVSQDREAFDPGRHRGVHERVGQLVQVERPLCARGAA